MKILVIRFSSLGDLVLATGLVKRLKECFPGDEIHFLTKDIYADIFEHNPDLDRVIGFPSNGSWSDLNRLIGQLNRENYSLVLDIHNQLRSFWVRTRLRAGRKITISKKTLPKLAQIALKRNTEVTPLLDLYFQVLSEAAGQSIIPAEPCFTLAASSQQRVQSLLKHTPGKLSVVIHPKANWQAKEWPLENYIDCIQLLTARFPELTVYCTGSPMDEPVLKIITRQCPGVVPLAGILSINELAYLVSRTGLCISGDTAIIHIARAFRIPQVIILGATVKAFGYIPDYPEVTVLEHELDCRPCSRNGSRPCPRHTYECLFAITVDDVFTAAETVLNNRPPC